MGKSEGRPAFAVQVTSSMKFTILHPAFTFAYMHLDMIPITLHRDYDKNLNIYQQQLSSSNEIYRLNPV